MTIVPDEAQDAVPSSDSNPLGIPDLSTQMTELFIAVTMVLFAFFLVVFQYAIVRWEVPQHPSVDGHTYSIWAPIGEKCAVERLPAIELRKTVFGSETQPRTKHYLVLEDGWVLQAKKQKTVEDFAPGKMYAVITCGNRVVLDE